jgi:4-hydroxysphinganine ceramide fatty acyl 2-hydroxylase
MQVQNKGQARLFKSKYLEALTKAPPLLIWGMYLPLIIFLVCYSYVSLHFSVIRIAFVFTGAMLSWTLFEYMAHRYVFHFISKKPRIEKFAYTLHGNHHHYPKDRQRLFMPPVPSLFISSSLFGIFYLLMDRYAFIFFPGFVLGYLLYASMHYAIHAWAPPFSWLKPLWRNHQLHHYRNEEKGFGVSTPLWDWVFGTRFDLEKEIEDKEKVRELMFEKQISGL